MPSKTGSKKQSFEDGLSRLETIARQMEEDKLPLEDLFKLYEEGMLLSKTLSARLDEAEGRMREITADENGDPAELPDDPAFQTSLGL